MYYRRTGAKAQIRRDSADVVIVRQDCIKLVLLITVCHPALSPNAIREKTSESVVKCHHPLMKPERKRNP